MPSQLICPDSPTDDVLPTKQKKLMSHWKLPKTQFNGSVTKPTRKGRNSYQPGSTAAYVPAYEEKTTFGSFSYYDPNTFPQDSLNRGKPKNPLVSHWKLSSPNVYSMNINTELQVEISPLDPIGKVPNEQNTVEPTHQQQQTLSLPPKKRGADIHKCDANYQFGHTHSESNDNPTNFPSDYSNTNNSYDSTYSNNNNNTNSDAINTPNHASPNSLRKIIWKPFKGIPTTKNTNNKNNSDAPFTTVIFTQKVEPWSPVAPQNSKRPSTRKRASDSHCSTSPSLGSFRLSSTPPSPSYNSSSPESSLSTPPTSPTGSPTHFFGSGHDKQYCETDFQQQKNLGATTSNNTSSPKTFIVPQFQSTGSFPTTNPTVPPSTATTTPMYCATSTTIPMNLNYQSKNILPPLRSIIGFL